ncbi:SDR family NAD(P)-dependent oxidoreductase [Acinetobacter larvae]|uniref:3-hydroxyacyl-CoA dehydrogenase n=1 Tax=Acinetobacter larvae TaxID=1789224 RepID=A0A1B2M3X1_9GAMM|nr:SDR family NAD(P)-dependent oxidoreductase [Acinetobacter larvae]AOA59906.1 3-hydroxyacyl-CoA dehydrogenase [Acinetobacter larvae]
MQIKSKAFIVTGAASGLGEAVARRLIAEQAQVYLVDLKIDALHALAQDLGTGASVQQLDVTDEQQVADFFAQLSTVPLAGLINCAGIAPAEKLLKKDAIHQLASFQQTLNINVVGSFNMARYAAAAMAQQPLQQGERGVIIQTASVAAYEGQIGQVAYAASKGAIVSMTLPMARELARHAIRVMTIAPGIMATPMLKNMPEPVQRALAEMVPFPKRLGEAEEFARLVQHIIENAYLNGEVIRLDGAIRMAAQ